MPIFFSVLLQYQLFASCEASTCGGFIEQCLGQMNLHEQNSVCWPSVDSQDNKQTYVLVLDRTPHWPPRYTLGANKLRLDVVQLATRTPW